MSFAGVLMRSRARQTPSTMRERSSPSTLPGSSSCSSFASCFAVAGEAVGAEREGERRELRIVRGIGEAIGAGRQQAGQRPGRERVLVGGPGGFEREQDAGQAALRRGQEKVTAGLGFEAGGVREGARARIEALALLTPGLRGHEGHRDRRGGLAARKKHRMHGNTVH